MTHPARLHAHHAAILYALLAEANGAGSGGITSIPDGVLLDAPEQSRLRLVKGDRYSFGFQVLAADQATAGACVSRLVEGLRKVGSQGRQDKKPLWGNFRVGEVRHLAGTDGAGSPEPIPLQHIALEQERGRSMKEITLRFLSPLRWERPKPERASGATYFDDRFFPADLFARRTLQRVNALGYTVPLTEVSGRDVALVENQLVWLDLTYGHSENRKPIGGAVGRVVLRIRNPAVADLLVLGQYLRVGGNTRFGFGAYRIEELGPSPYRVERSVSLLDLALEHPALDRYSAQMDVASGRTRHLVASIRDGTYQPRSAARVILGGDHPRILSIPAGEDRVLQRAVLETIAPAIDLFFEESSTAYRKGLGRQRAAQRIREAYRDGYQWALRSDFHEFFDSIDHHLLRQRLDAYLCDDRLVDLIMLWVSSASLQPGRGLPTGSVLAPLLSNLFLDQFDERVGRENGRLVRYADDFLILFRDPDQARLVLKRAEDLAEELRLALNEQKTQLVDLTCPFDFLGFRFHRAEEWQLSPSGKLAHIDDLGWRQAPARRDRAAGDLRLSGEPDKPGAEGALHCCAIVGPGVSWMGAEGEDFIFRLDDDRPELRIPARRVGDLLVLGPPTIDRSVLTSARCGNVNLLIGDDAGRFLRSVHIEEPLDQAALLKAQVEAAGDQVRRLIIARALVRAKLLNHACLARVYLPRDGPTDSTPQGLTELAEKAVQAPSVEVLIGYEGAGAALWYGGFSRRIDPRFRFEKRVAPGADDPVNVLLNIGHTILHRLLWMAVVREGLAPSLGFLHQVRSGHPALASDLQEPFRHLVDRAVIEATSALQPGQFHPQTDGPYRLRIDGSAYRDFSAQVFRTLAIWCQGAGQSEPRSYRHQLLVAARALRRHLLDPETSFEVFTHP